MIVQRAAPGWADDIETDIMERSLSKIFTEISEVIDDDDFSDDPVYDKEVDVDGMFGDGMVDIAPTPKLDKAQNGDYQDYDVYDKGVDFVGNGTKDVDFEAIKADLVSEVMRLYDEDKSILIENQEADKAKFIAMHEAEQAHILKELQKVQEENMKLKAAFNSFVIGES